MKPKFPALPDIIRYSLVGLVNNVLVYSIYIYMTYFWLSPKLAITLFYPIGAITSYFGHMKYSFVYEGVASRAILRFILAYFLVYGLNLTMLFIFSDKLHLPHQYIQAVAIPVIACILFILLKYFVFSSETKEI